jgi:hypothetical protein
MPARVYKLRNTAHLKGRHRMLVGSGIRIFLRYEMQAELRGAPPPLQPARRNPQAFRVSTSSAAAACSSGA